MWHTNIVSSNIALVGVFLSVAAIFVGSGMEKSGWVVLGTVAAVVWDSVKAVVVVCTMMLTVETAGV